MTSHGDFKETIKVFCLSMQRTGTSSVGKFFVDFGFRWAGWPADQRNGWSDSWYQGDYEKIFSSADFRTANAYEDSPWWMPGFFKILYHRFVGAKFILFTRDPDAWFSSMVRHSQGNAIGDNHVHCKVYQRESEFFELLKSGHNLEVGPDGAAPEERMKIADYRDHYKAVYQLHNTEVIDFFSRHNPGVLHLGRLEDPEKWKKLGDFLGIRVPIEYESHLPGSM